MPAEDGSLPEALVTIERSHPLSVTFSPDGEHFAYIQYTAPTGPPSWFISAFPHGVGPLDIPEFVDLGAYANVHWSPAGKAFRKDLLELCPEAVQDSDACEQHFELANSSIESIRWIDGSRVLVLTREPPVLLLGSLNALFPTTGKSSLDGTLFPIVTWSQPDQSHSYSAAFASP